MGSAFERHIFRHIAERMNLTPEELAASLRRTKSDRREALMGTVAEAWIEQGRAEGIEKGRVEDRIEGQAGIVLRFLELRFGTLPDTARDRVLGTSAPALEAWAEAVLVATSLDKVLATGPGG